jgi:Fe-S-cluster containining protein
MNLPSIERQSELCKKCGGWCCKYAMDKVDKREDASPNYWNALEYQKVRALEVINDGKWIRFIHDGPCNKIDESTGLCKVYNDRPEVCRKFPLPMHYKSGWKFYCEIVKEIRKLNNIGE